MLSYRHAYHAGNYADVLKHLVLCKSLEYLIKKSTPILYIDTHSGAGAYALNSKLAQKTEEYKSGVGTLDFSSLPELIDCYRNIVQPMLASHQYPGSPLLAAHILREQDSLRLFEMHTTDFPLLQQLFQKDRRVIVDSSDGYQSLKALLPARQKRALVLMDPSYEVKSDYRLVVDAIKLAYRKMSTTQFLLWYPVVDRNRVETMIKSICNSGVRNVWRFELAMEADTRQYGMTGSGMLAINPPWTLADQLRELLPALAKQLVTETGYYTIEQLVKE
ncbi:MAG: 23S rRNA (adenine(2030)-N(6))-methyltransferase RlmJ [Gammaproteobacteria bacterium]|nr:23S rRNA (adenine(2030)-N(6))-methyltransferase RlmJ [Gammaproteobacteria bacterium]